ncbi:MAG: NAD(P)-dependent oxidoreductase [Planctomycetota bacterium]|nr:NAD(P)-dependent oxidoreductase [Planctomycetota bacterium]
MKIAFIGTGVMGGPMAINLLKNGHEVRVNTRTRAKAEEVLSAGGTWADSPAEAADGADAAIGIVGLPAEVEKIFLGDQGLLAANQVPGVVIDMATSPPSLARQIDKVARERGAGFLDAPVSGGDVGAIKGTLSIMVGGEQKDFDTMLPAFEAMGATVVHQGPAGSGQRTKLANQILVAVHTMATAEALLFAKRAGLDGATVIKSIGSGAAGSWAINQLGPRMLQEDYDPGFMIHHLVKDLRIATGEIDELGLELPSLKQALEYFELAVEKDMGHLGTQALILVLHEMNHQTP